MRPHQWYGDEFEYRRIMTCSINKNANFADFTFSVFRSTTRIKYTSRHIWSIFELLAAFEEVNWSLERWPLRRQFPDWRSPAVGGSHPDNTIRAVSNKVTTSYYPILSREL